MAQENKEKKSIKTIALLVAAGKSERMGGEIPKPYLHLGGEPILRRTIKAFLNHPEIDAVRVVIRREHHALYRRAIEGLTLMPLVVGGDSRQESVRRGLEALSHWQPECVLVHDAARPMTSPELISRVIASLDAHKGAVPALAVVDTVRRAKDGIAQETISREGLFAVQTPQGFNYQTLLATHRQLASENLTDDAALLEKTGVPVVIVEGDASNIKITTEADITMLEQAMTSDMETRTGMGFDVHALKPHDADTPMSQQYIKLCGIKIPFTHYLEGHSDADVGLHALVDAILGAIGAGDIGMHFPPDDRKWQGADSERFLLHAYELLKARGGELVHMDVTLICERPKVSQHREDMIKHIAATLKIAPDRVSVKATTTEKLGFTGRSEGIAAQAVATIKLPGSTS